MKAVRGFTLVEAIVYLAIFAVMMTFVVTLFVSGEQLFRSGGAAVEIQQGMDSALARLSRDLAESDPRSVAIGYVKINADGSTSPAFYPSSCNGYVCDTGNCPQTMFYMTTAIAMLSARGQKTNFDYSTPPGGCAGNPGIPCWHKWICYYLSPSPANQPATTIPPSYKLRRVEDRSIKAGSNSLPTIYAAPPATTSCANGSWEPIMRNHLGDVVASNVILFSVTNPTINTGVAPPALVYSNPFNFSPGSQVNFGGLPYLWINMQGMEYQNGSLTDTSRISAQLVIRN